MKAKNQQTVATLSPTPSTLSWPMRKLSTKAMSSGSGEWQVASGKWRQVGGSEINTLSENQFSNIMDMIRGSRFLYHFNIFNHNRMLYR